MIIKIVLIIILTTQTEQTLQLEFECNNLFEQQKYTDVIKTCSTEKTKTEKLQLIVLLSEFYYEISYDRLNYIFYNGGSTYEQRTGKKLFKGNEKKVLEVYSKMFEPFADKGYQIAQLIKAKIFYINVFFIKYIGKPITKPEAIKKHKIDMKNNYIKHLENYIQAKPEDVEVLFLLGKQGVESEYARPRLHNMYFSVKNEKYYTYLLKSAYLKHPGAQYFIDGVENWNQHLNKQQEAADDNDVESLYAIGLRNYYAKETNPEGLNLALEYFNKAAMLNHIHSLHMLTVIYSRDTIDRVKYLETLTRLTSLNNTDSMIILGDYYLCHNQKEMALDLYNKAKSMNSPLAQVALDDLEIDGEPSNGCD